MGDIQKDGVVYQTRKDAEKNVSQEEEVKDLWAPFYEKWKEVIVGDLQPEERQWLFEHIGYDLKTFLKIWHRKGKTGGKAGIINEILKNKQKIANLKEMVKEARDIEYTAGQEVKRATPEYKEKFRILQGNVRKEKEKFLKYQAALKIANENLKDFLRLQQRVKSASSITGPDQREIVFWW